MERERGTGLLTLFLKVGHQLVHVDGCDVERGGRSFSLVGLRGLSGLEVAPTRGVERHADD